MSFQQIYPEEHRDKLQAEFGKLTNEEAYQVAHIHNRYVKEYNAGNSINEKQLASKLAGNETDEYLRKQFEWRKKQEEKRLDPKR